MSILIGCAAPHPPILIPEIGGKSISEIEATKEAMHKMVEKVASLNPETLIFISPHSPAFSDAIAIKMSAEFEGSFAQFGAFSIKFRVKNDVRMAKAILDEARNLGILMADLSKEGYEHLEELDHGLLVPLYYLWEKLNIPVVSLSISYLSYLKHYKLGIAVRNASDRLNKKVAFIASGDLSHRLTSSAPAGYNPRGIKFDLRVKEIMGTGNFRELLKIDESLIEDAGECGLRSFITLGGVFDGYTVRSEVLSYEGPFGVGYMVVVVEPVEKDDDRIFITEMMDEKIIEEKERRKSESEPVKLARNAVESYVKKGKTLKLPDDLPDELLEKKAGVFVSLKRGKVLRGCIGSTVSSQENVAKEIIRIAIQAATTDPRFCPIDESELPDLIYSVDILNPPEPIPDKRSLDSKKYGVIVKSGFKTGLLLPDLEGVDTVEKQVNIAKQKAGLNTDETVKLFRFTVERYK